MMGDTPTGRVIRAVGPAMVMAIAVFMILTQLGISPVIVTATYIALIGAIALASALAFGLGGREAAADMVNSGYRKAQDQADTLRADAALARERGERDAHQAHPATEHRDERAAEPVGHPSGQRETPTTRGDSAGLVP
jgi:hypothetical protein